jgi:hypothetical protein
VGLYCGDVLEISQPLLPIGINTPTSIIASLLFFTANRHIMSLEMLNDE